LRTDLKNGLSNEEAKTRLDKFGLNKLKEEEGESIWEKIKE
jgi:magnesium-transporting ATPase (P-type)